MKDFFEASVRSEEMTDEELTTDFTHVNVNLDKQVVDGISTGLGMALYLTKVWIGNDRATLLESGVRGLTRKETDNHLENYTKHLRRQTLRHEAVIKHVKETYPNTSTDYLEEEYEELLVDFDKFKSDLEYIVSCNEKYPLMGGLEATIGYNLNHIRDNNQFDYEEVIITVDASVVKISSVAGQATVLIEQDLYGISKEISLEDLNQAIETALKLIVTDPVVEDYQFNMGQYDSHCLRLQLTESGKNILTHHFNIGGGKYEGEDLIIKTISDEQASIYKQFLNSVEEHKIGNPTSE